MTKTHSMGRQLSQEGFDILKARGWLYRLFYQSYYIIMTSDKAGLNGSLKPRTQLQQTRWFFEAWTNYVPAQLNPEIEAFYQKHWDEDIFAWLYPSLA